MAGLRRGAQQLELRVRDRVAARDLAVRRPRHHDAGRVDEQRSERRIAAEAGLGGERHRLADQCLAINADHPRSVELAVRRRPPATSTRLRSAESPARISRFMSETNVAASGASVEPSQPRPTAEPAARRGPGADAAPLIHARKLTKRFGEFTAVDGVDFDVQPGEAFGFLGPNGAGKTSTMRMIGCTSPISDGELSVLDMDPRRDGPRIRARLGVVPQADTLDNELTVRENLLIYGRYFGLPREECAKRADELLEFVQLADRGKDLVEPLSGGMKRRLTIARSLINEPDLMLLDEPTTGLDPQARHLLWDRLYRLKQRGTTLVLTTHYMDEAEQLCDRLVVMDKAKIVAEGSPRQLIERYSTKEVAEFRFAAGIQETLDGQFDGLAERIERLPDRVLLYADDGEEVVVAARDRGLHPETVLVRRSTLEDVFLRLTGRSLID